MQKVLYVSAIDADVVLARRKGTRNMRLSIRSDGKVRLSIPHGISERRALQFLSEKASWIRKHQKPEILLSDGSHVGKSHRLSFTHQDIEKPQTRLKTGEVVIKLPLDMPTDALEAQSAAKKAVERALLQEGKTLLPQRLQALSDKHNLPFKSCHVKRMKTRWGSCDSHKNIILNSYLMQLNWQLIDYVILHELTHTVHQHHQASFWNYLEDILPDCKERRKQIKQMPTAILATSF